MRIVPDETRCSSLGLCESVAPEVFEIDDSGRLLVLVARIPGDRRAVLQRAVDACPTGALSLRD